MAAYEYTVLDPKGRKKKGVTTGDSSKAVRQELRQQGLIPLEVNSVEESESGSGSSLSGSSKGSRLKINILELAVVTRQFATLLDSGMPIEASLTGLVEQAERHAVKSVLTGVRAHVIEGGSLADGMRKFPRSFPELYIASVAAGEKTGHLESVLERLADYTENRQEMQQKIGSAMVYPIILTLVSIAIVIGLMTYVVPQVVKVFADTGQALPQLTIAMISISDFIVDNGFIMLGVLVVILIGISIALRYPGPTLAWHKFILNFPLTKRLSRSLNTARMARTLSILIGSGVPLISGIRSSSEVVSNLVMRASLEKTAEEVEQGASLSRSLKRRKVFPPLLTQMVASGESSGQLDKMLEKSASSLEREVESRITVVVSLFEPMMILIMGVVVLVIVMAILLPIFDLNQLIT